MNSLSGHFLVASPHLPDPNFFRTVVLMIRHDEDGAFGVVLNRPLGQSIGVIWKALGISDLDNPQPIYQGGPVSGPLLAVHREVHFAEGEITTDVFYCTHKEHINDLVANDCEYRIFSGYSGWGPGQLEGELAEGSWLTTPASDCDIFAEPEELWKAVAARIGLGIIAPHGRPLHVPPNPEMN